RHRPGPEPVRRRLLGLCRHQLCAGQAARASAVRDSRAGRHPPAGAGAVPPASAGLPDHGADAGSELVPVPLAHRPGPALGRRVARVGPCTGLPGAPHPPGGGGGRRGAVRAGGCLHLDLVHPAVGRRHGGRAWLDRPGPDHLRHLAPGTGVAWGLPVRRRDHAA
ncbi:hypothetical protein KXX11_004266, partial [Aspergillus fumigatus]